MTLGELIDVFRREVADTKKPYLWSDDEAVEFANDAVMEAVRRGFQILDSTTPEICEVPYAVGDTVLALDPRIIVVRSAIVRGQIRPLDRMKVERMNLVWPGWQTHTAIRPTMWVDDVGPYQMRIYPTPTAVGVIDLSVMREPLEAMADSGDEPELPGRYHRSLVHWLKFRAYSKEDTETQDLARAQLAERAFAAEFGERRSARNERWAEEQGGVMVDTLC